MHSKASLILLMSVWAVSAQAQVRFEIDPAWPKSLPERWVFGELGGVCVDSHDHIAVVDRRNITREEMQTNIPAPTFVMFDRAGNVVHSWGDPKVVPTDVHGCSFDAEDNLWVAGNEDAIVQGYSHEGKLLLQIGTKGLFDTADGTQDGPHTNKSRERLNTPAQAVVDSGTGDIYIADGYGNKRIVVFDRKGNYLRQWGRQATTIAERTAPGVFTDTVHCIAMSNQGLLYVCDRQGSRVQVFDKMGKHVRDIHVARTDDFVEPEPIDRGTVWSVAFSPDTEQRYLYVMNGAEEKLHILDHKTGKTLSTFGRPGHMLGNFTHGHMVATDSAGNLYIAETNWGRRVQRFNLVK